MANGETSGSAPAAASAAPAQRVAACPQLVVQFDETNRPVIHTGDGPCEVCCPWTVPFGLRPSLNVIGSETLFVLMSYQQWLVFHLHVVTHQRLDRVIGPDLVA